MPGYGRGLTLQAAAQDLVACRAQRAAVTDELADADYDGLVGIIYGLSLSNALDLDVSSALLGKLQTNEHRFLSGRLPDTTATGLFPPAEAGERWRGLSLREA